MIDKLLESGTSIAVAVVLYTWVLYMLRQRFEDTFASHYIASDEYVHLSEDVLQARARKRSFQWTAAIWLIVNLLYIAAVLAR